MAAFSKLVLLLAFCLVALPGKQGTALAATHDRALTIDNDGCHFSPEITRALRTLPDHFDMQMHTERRAVRFSFENLHGVGIVEKWDAEWSEVRLYFREDHRSLQTALQRAGLRVDGGGHVEVPRAAEDDRALSVEANADKGEYFGGARSFLACGSV